MYKRQGVFMMNDMPEGDAISSVFWGDVFSAVVGLPFVAMEDVYKRQGPGPDAG